MGGKSSGCAPGPPSHPGTQPRHCSPANEAVTLLRSNQPPSVEGRRWVTPRSHPRAAGSPFPISQMERLRLRGAVGAQGRADCGGAPGAPEGQTRVQTDKLPTDKGFPNVRRCRRAVGRGAWGFQLNKPRVTPPPCSKGLSCGPGLTLASSWMGLGGGGTGFPKAPTSNFTSMVLSTLATTSGDHVTIPRGAPKFSLLVMGAQVGDLSWAEPGGWRGLGGGGDGEQS